MFSAHFYPPYCVYITSPLPVCDGRLLQPDKTLQDHLGGKNKAKSKSGFILGSRGTKTGAGQSLMVCKLSQPEFNLRHCSVKGLRLMPSRKDRQAIKQEQQSTTLGLNTIFRSLPVVALKEYSSDLVLYCHKVGIFTRDGLESEWSKLMQKRPRYPHCQLPHMG